MKRNYVTPAIAVEYYNLTQSIAACVTKINSLSAECVLKDTDAPQTMKDLAEHANLFTDGYCTELAFGMESEGICYHTSANAAFTS